MSPASVPIRNASGKRRLVQVMEHAIWHILPEEVDALNLQQRVPNNVGGFLRDLRMIVFREE